MPPHSKSGWLVGITPANPLSFTAFPPRTHSPRDLLPAPVVNLSQNQQLNQMILLSRKELFSKLRAAGCEPLRKGPDGRTKTRKDLTGELDAATKRASAITRAIVTQGTADRAAVKAKVLTASKHPHPASNHPAIKLAAELEAAWQELHQAEGLLDRNRIFAKHKGLLNRSAAIRQSASAITANAKAQSPGK